MVGNSFMERYKSHTIKFTLLMRTSQWFFCTFSELHTHHHYLTPERFHPPEKPQMREQSPVPACTPAPTGCRLLRLKLPQAGNWAPEWLHRRWPRLCGRTESKCPARPHLFTCCCAVMNQDFLCSVSRGVIESHSFLNLGLLCPHSAL